MTPLFSVIVPIYKVEAYVRKTVDSVLCQSFKNFQLILVDDGSPDGCPALCDGYAEKDQRVKVIHKTNGGLSDARNAGLDAASGDFVVWLDGDDYLCDEHALEHAAEKINDSTNVVFLNNLQTNISFNKNAVVPSRTGADFKKTFEEREWNSIPVWQYVCRRSFLLENNLYFVKGLIHEDEVWTPKMLCCVADNEVIPFVNEPFYFYVKNREGSIMTEETREQSDRYIIELYKHLSALYDSQKSEVNRAFVFRRLHIYGDRLIFDYSSSFFHVNRGNAKKLKKQVHVLFNFKGKKQKLRALYVWLAAHL